ncbi:MAG: cysteine peptidase family C39 domain-containing protein [Planctomycetota bacterium]
MLSLLLALALFAGFFALGSWVGIRRAKAAPWCVGAAVILIFLRIFWRLYPQFEYPLFPFDWYVDVRPWWVFAPAQFAVGVGAAKMSTKGARVGVGMLGLLLWVVSGQRMFLSYMLPQDEMKGLPDDKGVVRQTTDYTCGSAAAATVLTQMGVPSTEREMAGLCGTNAFTGTDEFGVAKGLRAKLPGRRVRVEGGDWEDLKKAPMPAAVTIRFVPWIDHWVVVLEVQEGGVIVGDPVGGRKAMGKDIFVRKWRGVMVTVEDDNNEGKNEKQKTKNEKDR